ncbi:MAG: hypothetical protein AABY62_10700 [Pseudomonadota bacterium]
MESEWIPVVAWLRYSLRHPSMNYREKRMAAPSDRKDSINPSTFSVRDVLDEECREISASRQRRWGRKAGDDRDNDGFIGLALSGGGIRSATFNLGLLQGLANRGLLRAIDYLSTVSGGGYIGSWLSAWIRSTSIGEVEKSLRTEHREAQDRRQPPEPPPIRNLRRYSSYLAPQRGAFTVDSVTLVATYVRNLLLNLTVLVALFLTFMLLPRLTGPALSWTATLSDKQLFYLAMLPLIFAVSVVAWNLSNLVRDSRQRDRGEHSSVARPVGGRAKVMHVMLLVMLPVLFAAWVLTSWLWQQQGKLPGSMATWAAHSAILYGGIWMVAALPAHALRSFLRWRSERKDVQDGRPAIHSWQRARQVAVDWLVVVITALLAGAIVGPLLRMIGGWIHGLGQNDGALWHAGILGMPLVLLVFALCAVLHVGLASRGFHEEAREWWSRLGALAIMTVSIWLVVCGIAVYGPWVISKVEPLARQWLQSGLLGGWLVASLTGVLAGQRDLSNAGRWAKRLIPPLVKITPYIFVVGLLLLLAVTIDWLLLTWFQASDVLVGSQLGAIVDSGSRLIPTDPYWHRLNQLGGFTLLGLALGAGVFALLLSMRIGVNDFSLHAGYGNRLVRAYLGASNAGRDPHPFTGFDTNDSRYCLHELRPSRGHEGPYLVVNTALNLVRGRELAWQERKAASFVFSPAYSGCDGTVIHGVHATDEQGCYRRSEHYARAPTLAKAMTISGAAASPNMGYYTSKALAFLMTVFNIRLGWWLGNPCHARGWRSDNPRFGLGCLVSELLGTTNADQRHVYLSDGGHFENLGVYELVRRRCRIIIASDAAGDGKFTFADLANAIDKCRTDFGIDISIDIEPVRAGHAHAAVGTIHYRRRDPASAWDGILIYLKASLLSDSPAGDSGREPLDVRAYREKQPAFPHETTIDQWFSEKQFEAYRALGEHIAMTVFPSAKVSSSSAAVEWFMKQKGFVPGPARPARSPAKPRPSRRAAE